MVRFSIGKDYKSEIQLNLEESIIDNEIEYNVYIDGEYANI
jgi:hypothetical protein